MYISSQQDCTVHNSLYVVAIWLYGFDNQEDLLSAMALEAA